MEQQNYKAFTWTNNDIRTAQHWKQNCKGASFIRQYTSRAGIIWFGSGWTAAFTWSALIEGSSYTFKS